MHNEEISEERRIDLAQKAARIGDLELLLELKTDYESSGSSIPKNIRLDIIKTATKNGHFLIVGKMLEESDIQASDLGWIAMDASYRNHLEILELILQQGLSKEQRNNTFELVKAGWRHGIPNTTYQIPYLRLFKYALSDIANSLE